MQKPITFRMLAGVCKYRDVPPPYRGHCEKIETPWGIDQTACASKNCPVWKSLKPNASVSIPGDEPGYDPRECAGWISCRDAMPPDMESVLGVSRAGKQVVMWRERGAWVSGGSVVRWQPTHWASLPSLPNAANRAYLLSLQGSFAALDV
jgi:hypothetical protein